MHNKVVDTKDTVIFLYSLYNRAKIEKELLAFHRLGEKAEFSSAPALPGCPIISKNHRFGHAIVT